MLTIKKVTKRNSELAKLLQATIFPDEKSPGQVNVGIETNNPANFIAFNGRAAVGIVGYYKEAELPEHLLINWFGVLPEFRNRGYGSAILKWLIKRGKRRNESYLTTYTEKGVNDAAISLYKKLGFAVIDYCNEEDVKNLQRRGVENNYVICCLELKKNGKKLNFEKINLQISKNLDALRKERE